MKMKIFGDGLHPNLFLILGAGIDVQAQTLGVKVKLVPSTSFLQNLRNISGILDTSELDVTLALLDGVTDKFGRPGFTLSSDDGGLFLLTGLVNKKSCSLRFLLGNLFGFDCSRELGGECKVLRRRVSNVRRRGERRRDSQSMTHRPAGC